MSHNPRHASTAPSVSVPTDKGTWRQAIRSARSALPTPERHLLAQAHSQQVLNELNSAASKPRSNLAAKRKVAAYFSSPPEPDTTVLLQDLDTAGYEVYLPVCEADFQLAWTRWTPHSQLAPSTLAPVLEPVGERFGAQLFADIELLFIPALAVDAAGLRLGQGGGYYDRFLPKLDGYATRVAALIYDDEFVSAGSFEVEPHDRPVGMVVTPSQVHRLNNGF